VEEDREKEKGRGRRKRTGFGKLPDVRKNILRSYTRGQPKKGGTGIKFNQFFRRNSGKAWRSK
jgi:hypothetical protein